MVPEQVASVCLLMPTSSHMVLKRSVEVVPCLLSSNHGSLLALLVLQV